VSRRIAVWCTPYADDDYPLFGHRSTKILSEGSKAWETGRTDLFGVGGNAELAALVLVRAIIATASTSKLNPSLNNLRQFLSFPPPLIHSPVSQTSATKLALNVEFNNPQFSQSTV